MRYDTVPFNINLKIYMTNRSRLAGVELGMSFTSWINDAIREKLDRERPIVNGQLPPAHMEKYSENK